MFLSEPDPPRGIAVSVLPGVRRIVARNPGRMTYRGTNTYLVDVEDAVAVIDPGPDDDVHVREVLDAAGGKVRLILLTHTHMDHAGAVQALRRETGAPLAAWHRPSTSVIEPDIRLQDNDVVGAFTALHTPGHAADHVCLAWDGANARRALFSADHVMSWSTSIVSPPDGNMADYFRSLRLLLERDDDIYLPGHGPPLRDPRPFVAALLQHRIDRENAVMRAIERRKIADIEAILDEVYGDIDVGLRPMAARSLTAHLLKLEGEGRVVQRGSVWEVR
jgi:glyoxylase-like metal-dependent hydrolase (beta-lactamase superfamily II)